jgi:hypothetical protein
MSSYKERRRCDPDNGFYINLVLTPIKYALLFLCRAFSAHHSCKQYPELKLSLLPTGETGGRPEGPTVNRPDRKVGITQLSEMSAEGAALQGMFTPSVAPSALIIPATHSYRVNRSNYI